MIVGIVIFLVYFAWKSADFFRSFVSYLCGAVVYFDYMLKNSAKFFNVQTFGAASFLGFLRPIYNILGTVGIEEFSIFKEAEEFQNLTQYTVINISSRGKYNFFSTCFSYFYKDFGVIGVFAISFIYGWICSLSLKKMESSMNVTTISVYVYLVSGLLTSMMQIQFANLSIALVLIYILILSKISKRIRKNETRKFD